MAFGRSDARRMYQDASARGGVEGADRHQLTAMLFDGLIDRLNQAKGAVERRELDVSGTAFSTSIKILAELRTSLDHKAGGKLSLNLDNTYEYSIRRLLHAQLNADVAPIEEVIRLIQPIREAWHNIRGQFLNSEQQKLAANG